MKMYFVYVKLQNFCYLEIYNKFMDLFDLIPHCDIGDWKVNFLLKSSENRILLWWISPFPHRSFSLLFQYFGPQVELSRLEPAGKFLSVPLKSIESSCIQLWSSKHEKYKKSLLFTKNKKVYWKWVVDHEYRAATLRNSFLQNTYFGEHFSVAAS